MVYFYPQLSYPDLGMIRAPGAGLGNLLFPWARSLIYAQETGGVQIAPTWRNIKIGPILRNERDKRFYGDIVLHRSLREVMSGIVLRLSLKTITENEFLSASTAKGEGGLNNNCLVCVSGMRDHFASLLRHRDTIRHALLARARVKPAKQAPFIAAHVRTGDFARPAAAYKQNTMIEIDWYKTEIERIYSIYGMRTLVFTDDATGYVRSCLAKMQRIEIVNPVNPLTDILTMSLAQHIICANSTFSLWAALLSKGTIPTRFHELFSDFPTRRH